ncbi:uracil DNA glycosylase superfamily protein [bacterium BMS3Bbin12]|nr:uracil DNA glycosylase superfamily protein [bacterium BMS3Abin12]GBE47051.1 uracil DNA glycosylase superfamily protein [bacterium BMS3Bbin12]GBE49456.1 uracil DNA glycosylase superfamily protein [bacterium BMS3Bbin13]HDO33898.1 uracil-DNA glycosylase [Chromatiales bacterium]
MSEGPAARRLRYLQAMGIPLWVPRERGASTPATAVSEPSADGSGGDEGLGWDELQAQVAACTRCGLERTRTQAVFGVGDRRARWMFVGEAPGADEDRRGEPFVGRAGRLLDAMLRAIDLERGQVYIANILKCRPPHNRDPLPEEVACCEPYLQRQVALAAPALIVALGRIAAHNLLKTQTSLGGLRGRVHRYGPQGIPVVVTYHPAYLLRSPGEKRKVWEDLCHARRVVAQADDDAAH